MSIWIIYIIIALSVSLTSYINIYRPAIALFEEITEEENSIVATIIYKIMWIILAFVFAPVLAYMLLRGDNELIVRRLVIAWIDDE